MTHLFEELNQISNNKPSKCISRTDIIQGHVLNNEEWQEVIEYALANGMKNYVKVGKQIKIDLCNTTKVIECEISHFIAGCRIFNDVFKNSIKTAGLDMKLCGSKDPITSDEYKIETCVDQISLDSVTSEVIGCVLGHKGCEC